MLRGNSCLIRVDEKTDGLTRLVKVQPVGWISDGDRCCLPAIQVRLSRIHD
jgi:hypothetical protein